MKTEESTPRAGNRIFRKIILIILAGAAFWYFRSGGNETTMFGKFVAMLLGWQIDVVLEVLGAVFMILLGITLVAMSAQVMTVPRMKPLTDPAVLTSPHPRDTLEAELQRMGFRFIGDFDAAMSATTSMRIRAYTDPERLHGAVLMDVKSGSEHATILEFSARLYPLGSIVTNNSPYPGISSYPPDKYVIRVPWKKTATKIMELHQELCRTAREEKFTEEPVSVVNFAAEVIKATRKDMEYQIETGRYIKIGEDQYRLSKKGILIAVPLLWLNMTYSFLFSWYRPSTSFFCWRLRRRLQELKLQIEEKNKPAESDEMDDETQESVAPAISAKEREAPTINLSAGPDQSKQDKP